MTRATGHGQVRRFSVGWPLIVGLCLACVGCPSSSTSDAWPPGDKPKVLVSFPPLHSFATNVAGDDAVVKCFLTTTGPHAESDPPVDRIQLAAKADVFFINGLGLEGALPDKIQRKTTNRGWKVVDLGGQLDPRTLLEGVCHHEHKDGKHDHDHGTDPHVWLDVRKVKIMVNGIRDELKARDPSHAAGYDQRAAAYGERLDLLREYGLGLFKDLKQKKLISFHDSLRYFADCYGLEIAEAIQVDPGVEPSAEKMKQIVELCLKDHITAIAVEPQFPTNTSAKAILNALHQKDLQARFVEIDPLETAPETDLGPELYEKKIRDNLKNLANVLK